MASLKDFLRERLNMPRTKTLPSQLKAAKNYEEKNKIKKVRVNNELYELLNNGTFGDTQLESSNNLYDAIVKYGIVKPFS